MPYFTKNQPRGERAAKVVADVVVGLLLLVFLVVFFGPTGGCMAVLVLEAALISIDYLVPSEDDKSGVAVR